MNYEEMRMKLLKLRAQQQAQQVQNEGVPRPQMTPLPGQDDPLASWIARSTDPRNPAYLPSRVDAFRGEGLAMKPDRFAVDDAKVQEMWDFFSAPGWNRSPAMEGVAQRGVMKGFPSTNAYVESMRRRLQDSPEMFDEQRYRESFNADLPYSVENQGDMSPEETMKASQVNEGLTLRKLKELIRRRAMELRAK
jgi:hypothetical protein